MVPENESGRSQKRNNDQMKMTGLGISNWMTIHFRPRPKWTSIRPRVTDPQNPELNDTKWQFKLRRQDRSFSISDSWDRSSKAMVHCQWTVQFQMTVHFRFDPMNQSEGEFENYPLANRKTSLTILGPSPRYFWTNSDPTTRINDAVVWWATAFANIVWKMTSYRVTSSMMSHRTFPQPGGPYMRTPRGGSIPICL